MRKVLLISVIFASVLAFSSTAMAKKDTQFTCPPTWVTIDTADPTMVCFDWVWGCDGDPIKYSIDVELLVSGEGWDDPLADIQELSFGTGDEEVSDETSLCVPVEAFQYWDGVEEVYVLFSGDAAAKVKALGKGPDFRQNNAFSVDEDFIVEQPVTE